MCRLCLEDKMIDYGFSVLMEWLISEMINSEIIYVGKWLVLICIDVELFLFYDGKLLLSI